MAHETLIETVERILKEDPQCRNSYKWLLIKTYKELGCEMTFDIDAFQEMPSPVSIDRVARKLKEDNPGLAGMDSVEDLRREQEESYRERYSKRYPVTSRCLI
jgi:hypothetical protein